MLGLRQLLGNKMNDVIEDIKEELPKKKQLRHLFKQIYKAKLNQVKKKLKFLNHKKGSKDQSQNQILNKK